MKKKNIFAIKFAIVAIAIGLMSPSVNVENVNTAENCYVLHVSLLNTAEARPVHRQARRVSRRTSRRTSRRVTRRNVAYGGGGRYYGRPGYYGGRPLVAFGTGLAVGTMITAASMPSSCVTTYVNGITYRRCGSSYYQPFYEGSVVSYRVVNSPY